MNYDLRSIGKFEEDSPYPAPEFWEEEEREDTYKDL